MDDCPGKLPKPKMKGLLQKQITINLSVAIGLMLIAGGLFKYYVVDWRKNKYAEFYRTYNPDKAFEAMVKLGADFQSIKED